MELDAAGAAIEAPRRFADRILGEVEARERDHASVRAGCVLERSVVACAEPRMAVGLVQAEHEATADAVLVQAALEVLVDPRHAVNVAAEVGVGVEDLGACGKLTAKLLVP